MVKRLLFFHPDITPKQVSKEYIALTAPHGDLSWEKPTLSLLTTTEHLLGEGVQESLLAPLWEKEEGSLFTYHYFLEKLKKQGLLCYRLEGDQPIATLVPAILDDIHFNEAPLENPLQLSRSATLSYKSSQWVLTSTNTSCKVVLHDPLFLHAIWSLAEPKTFDGLTHEVKALSSATLTSFLQLLRSASLLVKEESDQKRTVLSDCIKYAHKLYSQQVGEV